MHDTPKFFKFFYIILVQMADKRFNLEKKKEIEKINKKVQGKR